MKILGLGGSAHDFSAVLMEESNITIGIEEERLSRRKHGNCWWYETPCKKAIEYCLNDIDINDVKVVTSDIMPEKLFRTYSKISTYSHHLLHAASSYFYVEDDDIAIIVADGWGSIINSSEEVRTRETISFYHGIKGKLNLIGQQIGEQPIERNSFSMGISNSLGYFYNMITRLIGFGKWEEGKAMGLVAYGDHIYVESFYNYITIGNCLDGIFSFNPMENGFFSFVNRLLVDNGYSLKVRADVAASGQKILEDVLFKSVELLIGMGYNKIALSGGVALNSLANGKLHDYLYDHSKKLLLHPHVHDAGIALGAVAYELHKERQEKIPISIKNTPVKSSNFNLGKQYSDDEIISSILHHYPNVDYEVCEKPSMKIAEILSNNEEVLFFTGPSEFGPRALGYRSVLSNPSSAKIRNKINTKIKFREPFRPVAPIVAKEQYNDFFKGSPDRDYMISIAQVRPEVIDSLGSITHIDKTARVQTLKKESNPLLYDIISDFEKLSGVPIVCNTSFNRRGEPIVESPNDAILAFLDMEVKYLYLEGYILFKS